MIHAGNAIYVLPGAAEIARDLLEFVFIKPRILQITRERQTISPREKWNIETSTCENQTPLAMNKAKERQLLISRVAFTLALAD